MARLNDTLVDGYLLVGGDASSQNINTNTHNTDTSNVYTLNATKINSMDIAVSGNVKAKTITLDVGDDNTSPIIINNITSTVPPQVPNLNAEFLQGSKIGNKPGNIVSLNNNSLINDTLLPKADVNILGIVKIADNTELISGGTGVITATQLKTAINNGINIPYGNETIKGIVRFGNINEIDTNYSDELIAVSTKNLKKGIAGGVASLDSNAKILSLNLPDASTTTKGATQYATDSVTYTGTSIDTAVTPSSLSYVIKEKLNAKSFRYILDINNWENNLYTIYNTNITEYSIIDISPDWKTITDVQLKAYRTANLRDYNKQLTGQCRIIAIDNIPTVNIPIRITITGEIYN